MKLSCIFVCNFLGLFWNIVDSWSGDFNAEPKQRINAAQHGFTFTGNTTSPEYFKLLERDGEYLLIGARNAVYNISAANLKAQTPIYWPASNSDVQSCRMKGKTEENCHNFIRVLAKDNASGLLICGTNAFKPYCRRYFLNNGNYEYTNEIAGQGVCPFDPETNSTATFIPSTEEIYAGTVADFAGSDPLIYRRKITSDDFGVRTARSDRNMLSDPSFVGSHHDENHVYFWFKEGVGDTNACGKFVHSHVARVCRKDRGGGGSYSDTWTTFLKARLNCSTGGEYPFYFDEIVDISEPVTSQAGSRLVYAVFNSPYETVRASAVCAFDMQKITEIFSEGRFKTSVESNWPPVVEVPNPRPGRCVDNSKSLSDEEVNFVLRHPLLDSSVPNFFDQAVFVQTANRARFAQIAVDQVTAVDAHRYDVVFVGMETGEVQKLVIMPSASGTGPISVLIETITVFDSKQPLKNLLIYRTPLSNEVETMQDREGKLVIVSSSEVRGVPLYFCHNASTCSACVGLQDPYCAWDMKQRACVGRSNGNWNDGSSYIQNIESGLSLACSSDLPPQNDDAARPDLTTQRIRTTTDINNAVAPKKGTSCDCAPKVIPAKIDGNLLYNPTNSLLADGVAPQANAADIPPIAQQSTKEPVRIDYAESLAIAVLVTLAVALGIGFVLGYVFRAKKCFKRKRTPASSTNGSIVGEGRPMPLQSKPKRNNLTSNHIDAFEPSPKFNGEPHGVVLSLDEARGGGTLDRINMKNSMANGHLVGESHFATLPKDYRLGSEQHRPVRKMYL